MQNSQESLTYKDDGGGSLPEFLANFCDFFGLKITSKGQFSKLWTFFSLKFFMPTVQPLYLVVN